MTDHALGKLIHVRGSPCLIPHGFVPHTLEGVCGFLYWIVVV
ncbi:MULTISPECIES: hypothetical protein [unclassified Burkholderia]|nr:MULTISPECIES: hypothetical protein [unclassified Burkholderia]